MALGDGVPRDDAEAEKLFLRAFEADPAAGKMIASLFDPVLSDQLRNMEKAIPWYERAAERGHGPSLDSLGDIHKYGKGVPIDLEKAFDFFSRAATAGEVSGHFSLGQMYLYGTGRPVDYQLARKHYLLAAGCGNVLSMHSLGKIHAEGLGTERNQSEALRWFAEAMQASELYAVLTARTVAKMYRAGVLEAPDRAAMALSWVLVAVVTDLADYGATYEEARIGYLRLPRGTVKTAFEEAETLFNDLGLDVVKLRTLEREFMSQ
jgi:uncharacterized protein